VDLKTYQAYTMAEALAAVKRDLGPGAVILNTRSFRRGGFLGMGRKTIVQVTATEQAAEAPAPATPSGVRKKKNPPRAALRAYSVAGEPAGEPDKPVDMEGERLKTKRLAQALLEKHVRAKKAAEAEAPADASFDTRPCDASGAIPARAADKPPAEAVPASPTARRFLLVDPEEEQPPVVPVQDPAPPAVTIAPPPVVADDGPNPEAGAMRDELASIRRMVGEVLQRQTTTRQPTAGAMPQHLFDMYLEMIGQEVSEELADGIVAEVRAALGGDELEDPALVRAEVRARLEALIPTADAPVPHAPADGRPLTIALVGPTGVGKTTTLAKLAATFKLQHHRKVGLITADTYRIAAVDQLRTYANIIGLELKVALTPGEMKRAVHSMSGCDAILIDTAGRSQHDEGRIAELKEFIAAADPHEVHLVLSSTAGEKVLLREAEAFSTVGVDRVVLTKLDEAVSFGTLINVTRQIGAKLSYFTTGQEVPDHIELGRPQRLAGLVLGEKLNP
jgi:flagellar biosynthesis protein FlhF